MGIKVEFILMKDEFPVDEVADYIGLIYEEKVEKGDLLFIGGKFLLL